MSAQGGGMEIIMANALKWLWLSTMHGMTPLKISHLLSAYGSIDRIYECSDFTSVRMSFDDKKNLLDKNLDTAKTVYREVCSCGSYILTYDSPYYPQIMKSIPDPPYVLYLKGTPLNLNNVFGIGVVGTRNNTKYGEVCASDISYGLGRQGITIISGMAMGIDCISMHAAMQSGAKVIGVLGCGIDTVYPVKNKWLFDEVFNINGLVISEYPPGTAATKYTFPQRNRIIAGLSRGVLVIEGSTKSGSLITARYAKQYNRSVFAVPRNIGDTDANGNPLDGTNSLIKQGALLVTDADDIIAYFGKSLRSIRPPARNDSIPDYADVSQTEVKKQPHIQRPKTVNEFADNAITSLMERADDDMELSVIQLLAKSELYPDEIVQSLDKNASEMNCVLLVMETKGLIRKQPDGRYELNR